MGRAKKGKNNGKKSPEATRATKTVKWSHTTLEGLKEFFSKQREVLLNAVKDEEPLIIRDNLEFSEEHFNNLEENLASFSLKNWLGFYTSMVFMKTLEDMNHDLTVRMKERDDQMLTAKKRIEHLESDLRKHCLRISELDSKLSQDTLSDDTTKSVECQSPEKLEVCSEGCVDKCTRVLPDEVVRNPVEKPLDVLDLLFLEKKVYTNFQETLKSFRSEIVADIRSEIDDQLNKHHQEVCIPKTVRYLTCSDIPSTSDSQIMIILGVPEEKGETDDGLHGKILNILEKCFEVSANKKEFLIELLDNEIYSVSRVEARVGTGIRPVHVYLSKILNTFLLLNGG